MAGVGTGSAAGRNGRRGVSRTADPAHHFFRAGGSPDVVTRILAAELVKQMGQQIIIDNRPGAAQTIGTGLVVRAIPDGYTIGYANVVTLAINKTLLPKQPYDPDKDLALVGQFLSTYNLLAVTNSLPGRNR